MDEELNMCHNKLPQHCDSEKYSRSTNRSVPCRSGVVVCFDGKGSAAVRTVQL